MSIVLADIGGTHTRLGIWDNKKLLHCEKVKTASAENITDLITAYSIRHGLKDERDLAFATAANPHADGIWRFTNLEKREFTLDQFKSAGWNVISAEDDFSATTYGCLFGKIAADKIVVVKAGAGRAGDPKIVLGPGTGLGMGYGFVNEKLKHVQKAYGGHMLFTPLTDLHIDISRRITQKRKLDRPVIFEDIACGSAFPFLYDVCCEIGGYTPSSSPLDNKEDPALSMALSAFHEALGLFTHLAVVTIHGYGGVTMNGGFLDALIERDLWNSDLFLSGFHQKGVPVVTHDILQTPVNIVADSYVSLIGLGMMIDA